MESSTRSRSSAAISLPRQRMEDYAANLARIDNMCTRSTYQGANDDVYGGNFVLKASASTACAGEISGPDRKAEKQRRKEEKKERLQHLKRERFVSAYARNFQDYSSMSKPAQSRKEDADAEVAKRIERSRQARASALDDKRNGLLHALEMEESARNGVPKDYFFPKSDPPQPPAPLMHANFVGGLPPNYWRSELKGNLTNDVFSKGAADRYQQPTQLVVLGKYNRIPLGGTWGSMGDLGAQ